MPPLETMWNGPLCHTDRIQRNGAINLSAESATLKSPANVVEGVSVAEAMRHSLTSSISTQASSLEEEDSIRVAVPTLVRHPMLSESSRRRSVVPFSTVVLVSSGVLTHYDHKGNVLWQT